jgi:hypothetical protein
LRCKAEAAPDTRIKPEKIVMAMAPKETLPYQEGPYEQWALGIGAGYADLPPSAAAGRFYAAIATLPAPIASSKLPEIDAPNAMKAIGEPLLPTIWGRSLGIKLRFLPVIAEVGAADRALAFRGFMNWATSLTPPDFETVLIPGLQTGLEFGTHARAADLRAQVEPPGLRLNVPVADDTIDRSFTQQSARSTVAASTIRESAAGEERKPAIVVTAVIDDGVAFAHRNFRDRNGKSRIDFCWLQSAKTDGSGRVLFGRELSGGEIDGLLSVAQDDEEQVYASIPMSTGDARYGTVMRRSASHGTHVLDIAAGHRHGQVTSSLPTSESEGLDRIRIIAVQLPPSAIADTAGFGKDAYFLSAFHYVLDRADAVFESRGIPAAEQWLTVNFSYGATGGPNDGTGRMESAIHELVMQRRALGKPTQVIMPAGNTFSSALYGEIWPSMMEEQLLDGQKLDEPGQFTIPWRLQPNSRAASHIELWFPANPSGSELEITAPGERISWSLKLDAARTIELTDRDQRLGQASLSEFSPNKWLAVVSLVPTEPNDETKPAAPGGLWRIRFRQPESNRFENPVRCRIQRSESPFGFATGARQSYFDDPRDERFSETGALASKDTLGAFVRRFGSLNGMAISDLETIWIVGGTYADSLKPTDTSAAGPASRNAGQPYPYVDLSAPSDDSWALRGRLAAGTLSGVAARLSGTSVAAPFAARALALAALAGVRPPLPHDQLGGAIAVPEIWKGVPNQQSRLGKTLLTDPA